METQPHRLFGWQRLVQRLAATRLVSPLLAPILHHIDRPLMRLSGNRWSLTGALAGFPVALLTTTGARSGQARTSPVLAILDGERVALVASNFGRARYPAWYHNLRARPEATISIGGRERIYAAREAEGDEHAAYWQKALALYVGIRAYKAWVGEKRRIPIMVLTPREE